MIYPKSLFVTQKCIRFGTVGCRVIVKRSVLCGSRAEAICTAVDVWHRREKRATRRDYKIPESFSAFWSMVSFTAAKTSRIFEVSVACVKLEKLAKRVL